MHKLFWDAFKANPIVFGTLFLLTNSISAAAKEAEEIVYQSVGVVTLEKPNVSVESANVSFLKQVEESQPLVSPNLQIVDTILPQATPAAEAVTTDSTTTLEQINRYNNNESESNGMEQVTNVSQLKDISSGDWAFEALQLLVERYGCICWLSRSYFPGKPRHNTL